MADGFSVSVSEERFSVSSSISEAVSEGDWGSELFSVDSEDGVSAAFPWEPDAEGSVWRGAASPQFPGASDVSVQDSVWGISVVPVSGSVMTMTGASWEAVSDSGVRTVPFESEESVCGTVSPGAEDSVCGTVSLVTVSGMVAGSVSG